MILAWYGSIATIPSGFSLCDGNNGTPDLRDRFVIGAKEDDAGVSKTNVTGALTKSGGDISHSHQLAGAGTIMIGTPVSTVTDTKSHLNPYYALAFIMKT